MSEKKKDEDNIPVAGPHAKPELTDKDRTPGTGMLPDDEDANQAPTG